MQTNARPIQRSIPLKWIQKLGAVFTIRQALLLSGLFTITEITNDAANTPISITNVTYIY